MENTGQREEWERSTKMTEGTHPRRGNRMINGEF
jgi:hypothetical protein